MTIVSNQQRIAPWGLELTLLRTALGAEFQIARRLGRLAGLQGVRFFGTYGYFDLTCVKVLDTFRSPSSLTLDPDITESATFRFVSPTNGEPCDRLIAALNNCDTAIASFLKIHPFHVEASPVRTRWVFAQQITNHLSGAFVFCGFGTCELLVVLCGRDLPRLLQVITNLREPDDRNPLHSLRRSLKHPAPLFAGTSTIPLISFERIHRVGAYDRLQGMIEPAISISCDPESEAKICSQYSSQLQIQNVYGRHDLVLTWPKPIPMSLFAKTIAAIRLQWSKTGTVAHTTSYLEHSRGDVAHRVPRRRQRKVTTRARAPRLDTELKKRTLELVEPPGLRAAVTDVALRLNACSTDGKIGTHYADMLNTFEYLQQTISKVTEKRAPEYIRNRDRFEITHIVDSARRAILQRHAGLESRPELLAYAESPFLCDIRLLVAAASCIPYYIFDNLLPNRKAEQTWSGYVLFFGDSPRWLRQNILALPAASIFDPIREWWKVTHEAAHAVFKLLEREERLGANFTKISEHVQRISLTGIIATRMISEIFANWFDWNYVFQRETRFYISTIWQSWLDQPAVFSRKIQYLTRSLAIVLLPDLRRLGELRQRGRRSTFLIPYLRKKYREMARIIAATPVGAAYFRDIGRAQEEDIFELIEYLHPLLLWLEHRFETDCGLVGLRHRLCPPYPNLLRHCQMITHGRVVLQKIANPCQLHLRLLRRLATDPKDVCVDAAYVFTLANAVTVRNTKPF